MEKEAAAQQMATVRPAGRREQNTRFDEKHIDVLDGIRALAVLGVLWFHFWQQNWISPYFRLPFLTSLGLSASVSLDFLPRAGFLFVDLLLFLSAFCLFLPYVRASLDGAALPDAMQFYKKRIARIVPSYYFAVLVILFAVTLPSGEYHSAEECLADLLPTLTFTQTLFPNILLGTKLNGVLWTAAIEMQFYLFFPLLAAAFVKKPGWTYLGMVLVSVVYLRGFALQNPDSIRTTLNQLPGFFGVFANGMVVSYLYVLFARRVKRSAQLSAVALCALGVGIWILVGMMKEAPGTSPVHLWQAENRFRLSLVFALIVVSSATTFSGVRWFFSNAVMRFLSAISYNLYIWHQWISVKFKQWKIPYWTGDKPPNMTGDRVWQWKYTALILGGAFLTAILTTYLIERPAAKWILKPRIRQAREPMVSACCEEPAVERQDDTEETNK